MIRISDNDNLPPIEYTPDPELTKWARYGIEQLKRHNVVRAAYEQAERDCHAHNRDLDGQA